MLYPNGIGMDIEPVQCVVIDSFNTYNGNMHYLVQLPDKSFFYYELERDNTESVIFHSCSNPYGNYGLSEVLQDFYAVMFSDMSGCG